MNCYGIRLIKSLRDEPDARPFYRANELRDHYNELTLRFKKAWNVEFRAYDDGIVYRFVSRAKKPFNVLDEIVDYQFPFDAVAVSYTHLDVYKRQR